MLGSPIVLVDPIVLDALGPLAALALGAATANSFDTAPPAGWGWPLASASTIGGVSIAPPAAAAAHPLFFLFFFFCPPPLKLFLFVPYLFFFSLFCIHKNGLRGGRFLIHRGGLFGLFLFGRRRRRQFHLLCFLAVSGGLGGFGTIPLPFLLVFLLVFLLLFRAWPDRRWGKPKVSLAGGSQ